MLFPLSFFCCHPSPPSGWEYDKVNAINPQYNCCRLKRSTQSSTSGIGLELIQANGSDHLFLNVDSIPVMVSQVTASTALEERTLTVEPFVGGQRFLITKESADWLLSELKEGHDVEISLGRYYESIDAQGFLSYLEKLTN